MRTLLFALAVTITLSINGLAQVQPGRVYFSADRTMGVMWTGTPADKLAALGLPQFTDQPSFVMVWLFADPGANAFGYNVTAQFEYPTGQTSERSEFIRIPEIQVGLYRVVPFVVPSNDVTVRSIRVDIIPRASIRTETFQ